MRPPVHGPDLGPGDYLLPLLRRVRLSQREQTVLMVILDSPVPMTSRAVSRRTGFAYSHAKAVVRTLIAWGILLRQPEGVSFQPDPTRWGLPGEPLLPMNSNPRQT